MSEKIKPHHLERKAILYIRQSSLYQVNDRRSPESECRISADEAEVDDGQKPHAGNLQRLGELVLPWARLVLVRFEIDEDELLFAFGDGTRTRNLRRDSVA
jgi:hypothetical protein